ncbi:MAG: class II fructose-bisphosphate aldolase [Enterocloster bolteae]|uniref:class II fructose-bisphosphate aldolase n=1 Tax=Enterocloster bolteae TaxID=208479 RepID=UPI003992EE7D
MLVNSKVLLEDAMKHNYAVAGINTTSLTMLRAVLEAAEEEGTPVILSHAQLHEPYAPIELMGPLMKAAAEKSTVPCSLHLDHGTTEAYIYKALSLGFTSVMADFARFSFEENVERTKKVADVCHEIHVTVEGEYGEMPSNVTGQGRALPEGESLEFFFTKPDKAARYVEQTGVDSLVVSFGSVHGIYIEEPKMDYERLGAIREAVSNTPLVMHGGSGLSEEDTRTCIDGGIRKINYYTYMACEPSKKLVQFISSSGKPPYFHEICEYSRELMKEKARYAIKLFQNRG